MFFLRLRYLGEQEFTARNAGLSLVVVFCTMVPLLLLIIVITHRYIKRMNLEAETKEREVQLARLEDERQKIYETLFAEDDRKEVETVKSLQEHKEKILDAPHVCSIQIRSDVIDDDRKGEEKLDPDDGTDDELFEMPLPPIPQVSSPNEKLSSIIDNEGVSPSMNQVIQTFPSIRPFQDEIDVESFPSPVVRPANSPSTLTKEPETSSELKAENINEAKFLLQSDF